MNLLCVSWLLLQLYHSDWIDNQQMKQQILKALQVDATYTVRNVGFILTVRDPTSTLFGCIGSDTVRIVFRVREPRLGTN